MPLLPGLCSVTFRKLEWQEVLDIASEAGLSGIEWGGDVHVPPGNFERAEAVKVACNERGIAVASYGSYVEAGNSSKEDFRVVLATAVALGAPNIRIWAGKRGTSSADASDAQRAQCLAELITYAQLASQVNVTLSLEYHRDTLTDTLESTVSLLDAAGDPNLQSYWQPAYFDPPRGTDPNIALAELQALRPRLSHLHVFQWAADRERLPLCDGKSFWQPVLPEVNAWDDRERFAFLEFVRNDDPEQFATDAKALKRWTAGT